MKIEVTYIPSETPVQVTEGGLCIHNSTHSDYEWMTVNAGGTYEHEVMVNVEVCDFCGAWKQDEYNGWQER